MPALTAASVQVGDTIPEQRTTLSAQKIISAAAATRDWQPIHHDHAAATKAGLRGIILNSPSQAGWISKFITDWAGAAADIRKMSFRMKDSFCPDDEMILRGEITAKDEQSITAVITLNTGDVAKTTATVTFTLPH
ncbi:MAG: MaoC/PaaZ C-terminal domain-containing protein [Pseudomonadales bacterium]